MIRVLPTGFLKIVHLIAILTFILTFFGIIWFTVSITKEIQGNKISHVDFQINQVKSANISLIDQTEQIKRLETEKQEITFYKILSIDVYKSLKDTPKGILLLVSILFGPSVLVIITLVVFSVIVLYPLKRIFLNELLIFQWLYAVSFLIIIGLAVTVWVYVKSSGIENFIINPSFYLNASSKNYISTAGSFIADVELGSVVSNAKITCYKPDDLCKEISTTISKDGVIDSDLTEYPVFEWNEDFVTAYNLDPECTWYFLKIDLKRKIVAKFKYKKPDTENETNVFDPGCSGIEKTPFRMLLVDGFNAWPKQRNYYPSYKQKPAITDPSELELPDVSYSQIHKYDEIFQLRK